jgi:hypothetical protein
VWLRLEKLVIRDDTLLGKTREMLRDGLEKMDPLPNEGETPSTSWRTLESCSISKSLRTHTERRLGRPLLLGTELDRDLIALNGTYG